MPTVISGTTLNALTTVSWGVISLFANNEQGVWFDPSDLNNYMSGLGPELVTNGDFSNGTTGWTTHNAPTVSIDSQRVKIIGTGGSSGIYQDVTLDASKSYEIKGVITTDVASSWPSSITLREGGAGTFSSISGYSDVYAAAGTSANARWVLSGRSVVRVFLAAGYGGSGGIAFFDNISVKELTTISSATMYQDAAGTTPVTAVEQPVGLLLDKSKGLVVSSTDALGGNGNFSNASYWADVNGVSTISGGQLSFNGSATIGGVWSNIANPLTIGRFYQVTFDVVSISSGGIRVWLGTGQPAYTATTAGSHTYRGACTGDREVRIYNTGTATTAVVDNVVIREIAGNHARQTTDASRPVLSAKVNLLTYSEQFDNAAWAKIGLLAFGSGSTANATTAPDGTLTADLIVEDTTTGEHKCYRSDDLINSTSHTWTVHAKPAGRNWIVINAYSDGNALCWFDVQNGVIGTVASGCTASITAVANGFYRCSVTRTTATTDYYQVYIASGNNSSSYTGNGTSGIYIWGADHRVTNVGVNLPAYQRVGAATDYDTSGFPLYLKFDGFDDSLSTGTIDFTATDKMSLFAGVRKQSDAVQGFIAYIGDGNTNDFLLQNYTDASFYWGAGGSSFVQISSPNISSPTTRVLTGLSNISADSLIFRVNGSSSATSASDQGTGQFSSSTLKVCGDSATTKYFNGNLYNLIVRGALSNSVDITNTEAYINSKTKAY